MSAREKGWCFAAAAVVLLSAFVGERLRWEYQKDRQFVSFRTKAVERLSQGPVDIVFVGSSHIYAGVDPSAFSPAAVNLAESGLNYQFAEALCEKYWSRIQHAQLVVLELDAVPVYQDTIGLRRGDLRNFWEWGLASWELPAGWWVRVAGSVSERLAPGRYGGLWPMMLRRGPASVDGVIGPGFHGRNARLNPAAREAFFAELGSTFDESTVVANLAALQRLVERLRAANVEVRLFRPPFHRDYWEHSSSVARERYVQRAVACLQASDSQFAGREILDLSQWNELDDHDFADWTHVSLSGARKLSAELAMRLGVQRGGLGASQVRQQSEWRW